MSNHVIYTASEFEKMTFLKIKVSVNLKHLINTLQFTYSYNSAWFSLQCEMFHLGNFMKKKFVIIVQSVVWIKISWDNYIN